MDKPWNEMLRDTRVGLGLTQREVAETARMKQSALSRIESGSRSPRLDTLQRLAGAMGCVLEVELVERTED